jgi:hypothetical protein
MGFCYKILMSERYGRFVRQKQGDQIGGGLPPIRRLFSLGSFLRQKSIHAPPYWATFSRGRSFVLILTKNELGDSFQKLNLVTLERKYLGLVLTFFVLERFSCLPDMLVNFLWRNCKYI